MIYDRVITQNEQLDLIVNCLILFAKLSLFLGSNSMAFPFVGNLKIQQQEIHLYIISFCYFISDKQYGNFNLV